MGSKSILTHPNTYPNMLVVWDLLSWFLFISLMEISLDFKLSLIVLINDIRVDYLAEPNIYYYFFVLKNLD